MKLISILLFSILAYNTAFAKNEINNDKLITNKVMLTPDQVAKKMMGGIVAKLRNKQDFYRKNPDELKKAAAKLMEDYGNLLDMPRMSWSIIGTSWRSATKPQKRAFIAEFKTLLINTYVNSLLDYVNKDLEYRPFHYIPRKRTATIRSFVLDGGKKLPIVYRLYQSRKHGWRIYDVTVVGISLIKTYKSSYQRTIHASGIVGLTNALKKKNAK